MQKPITKAKALANDKIEVNSYKSIVKNKVSKFLHQVTFTTSLLLYCILFRKLGTNYA